MKRLTATALSLALLGACANGAPPSLSVNTVSRSYGRPMSEVWPAVLGSIKDLDLRVEEDQHDALGGELTAHRANRDEVKVRARAKDGPSMEVSVAVEPGDRVMAQMIQDRIAEKLGAGGGAAKTGFVSGSRVEGVYDYKLENCLVAGKRAMVALKIEGAREERHDTWAKLEARQADAFPVQIRMERTARDQTRVEFTAGTGPADDNRALAQRLKTEFERHVHP
jgi:hypothetical protein